LFLENFCIPILRGIASMTNPDAKPKALDSGFLERYFQLSAYGTDVRTEVLAGLATFMTMSYIIFVNPSILSAAGIPFGAAIAATALCAGLVTLFMGLYANYPFALAAGMGLNAAVVFGLVQGAGVTWQVAMGVIFIEGVIVLLLVLTGLRELVFMAIPVNLKRSIGVGIGLFIATIGMQGARLSVANPASLMGFNPNLLGDPVAVVAMIGLVITAVLVASKTKGAILLGMLSATVVAVVVDVTGFLGGGVLAQGALAGATAVVSMPAFDTIFQLDIAGALQVGLIGWIFAILITDFFDTMGTVVAIGGEAKYLDKQGNLPRLREVLIVDSVGAIAGGLFGISSNTTYIESAAGVSQGGRTGLTSVVVAICFFLAIFFSPIIGLVPQAATAPALIVVGFLMISALKEMDWDNWDELIPGFVIMISVPLTFNIAYGIGFGFILYSLIKLLRGKGDQVSPLLYVISLLFLLSFYLGH